MKDLKDKIAVVTGAGSGIGRELARQLAEQGCHVALCDISAEGLAETAALCLAGASPEAHLLTHGCDVSDESQVIAFRDAVTRDLQTDHINLLFNNAGVSGGGSFILDSRSEWERIFAICWGGIYLCTRAFMPLLIASREGHLVNMSSVNGFWASTATSGPHSAYSTAKFAVKGFTEAMINDLRLNAPHVKVTLVMPGHVGTSIGLNSQKAHGARGAFDMSPEHVERVRSAMARRGLDLNGVPDDVIRAAVHKTAVDFRDKAPVTAARAAATIIDAVRHDRWRVLVGEDAHTLDRLVRESPETAYEEPLLERLSAMGHFQIISTVAEQPRGDGPVAAPPTDPPAPAKSPNA